MKFLSFLRKGQPTFGAVIGHGIVQIGGRFDSSVNTLREAIKQSRVEEAAEYAQLRAVQNLDGLM